jgi:hypothetical protein
MLSSLGQPLTLILLPMPASLIAGIISLGYSTWLKNNFSKKKKRKRKRRLVG